MSRHSHSDTNAEKRANRNLRKSLEAPVVFAGKGVLDQREFNYDGKTIRVARLIEADNSNYDAADDVISQKNTPQHHAEGKDAEFYENPYSSCENSAIKLSKQDMQDIRSTMRSALSKRGVRVNMNSFNGPISEDLALSSGLLMGETFVSDHSEHPKQGADEYAPTIKVLAHEGRSVPWGDVHDSLVALSKKEYTLNHSSVKEFELKMRGRLNMNPFGRESFMKLTQWVEEITAIGIHYLGAQQVQWADETGTRIELIFSADKIPETKTFQENLIPDEETTQHLRKLRPWDPLPVLTEADRNKGKIEILRIIIHCVFETHEPTSNKNYKDLPYRFVFYFYSN